MDNIPKLMVSVVLIMLCLIMGISLIFTSVYIDQARSYHDSVLKTVSGSDFSAAKIQDCVDDAHSKGFALEVEPSPDGYVYKVRLTYSITVPLFGTWSQKTITGYAVDYTSLYADGQADGSGVMPQLVTPTISLEGSVLSITPVANATSYTICVGRKVLTSSTAATIDLASLNLDAGQHLITVIAVGDGYSNSGESVGVLYTVD